MTTNIHTLMRGPCRLCGQEWYNNPGQPHCKNCELAHAICWPNEELDEVTISNRTVLLRRLSIVIRDFPPSFEELTYREHFENSYKSRIREIVVLQHRMQPVPEKLKRPFVLKPDGTPKTVVDVMAVPGKNQKRADVDEKKPRRGDEAKPKPKPIKL